MSTPLDTETMRAAFVQAQSQIMNNGTFEPVVVISKPLALSLLDEIDRLRAIVEDLVSDLASTEATHDEVYYAWEGIVRRANGMVADIIRNVSAEDDEWTWDQQLP